MRIVCHAQALQGVGHFVRMQTIARALARAHEVHLVDGGRPVPRPPADAAEPRPIRLPALVRSEDGLRGVSDGRPGDAPAGPILAARAAALVDAVERIRPDAVLVDHYPFSKWDLEPEIQAMIAAARRAQPGVRVVCSLRDIAPQTRHEAVPRSVWEERVVSLLRAQFDAVFVHTDPTFVRLDEHFAPLAHVGLPVHYTGFVGAPIGARPRGSTPHAVLSCGGGTRSLTFLAGAIEAFRTLRASGALGEMELRVFPGAFAAPEELATLRAAAEDAPVHLEAFSADFGGWLAGAALSIGRAGYNTVVQLLQTRVRAVVVPEPGMSDQEPRARRLAAHGLATAVGGDPPRVGDLAAAIRSALDGAAPRHGLDLDGAAATRSILEQPSANHEGPWRSTATSASRSTRA
jgi:predicted glycosyltransferase